jgi:hypothetical protein
MGREGMRKGMILKDTPHPNPLPQVEREEERNFFKGTPHFYSLTQEERRKIKRIYLIKIILFVFVNFGVFNV